MRRFFLAVVLILGSSPGAFATTAHYVVTYDGGKVIHVAAQLPKGDGRLEIAQGGGIDQLPAQWATFVQNLTAVTSAGTTIATTSSGKEGWTIDSRDPVRLTYDVDLQYAIGQWPAGNEQSGRRFAHALYSVTKPLFLYTSDVTEASVRFVLPTGWKIAAPWDGAGHSEFRVATLASLIDNSFVIGVFPSVPLHVGSFDVTVATPGLREAPPLLVQALTQTGALVAKVFDKTPPGRYVMTFFRENDEDGESYESSSALTSPVPFDRAGMIVTGNTVVHELLHYWIGGKIAPRDRDSLAWFSEGFTEYYANVTLAHSGAAPADLLLSKLTNHVAGYLYFFESPLFSKVTLADAGARKGSYRFGVYNGGWAVALSLDVLLRSESNQKHSLDDVMRLLFERNGLTNQPITLADISKAASDVAGRDLSAFFETYINKREALPISKTMQQLGLDLRGQSYAADIFLIEMPNATPGQLALRRSILGRWVTR